jgi:hypothetical protein
VPIFGFEFAEKVGEKDYCFVGFVEGAVEVAEITAD